MKFSTALALCAAPLALASTLQVDLMKRGAVDVEVSQQSGSSGSQKSSSDSKSSNNNAAANNNAAKGQQSSTSITEVIILWVNNGGSATTSSVNSAQAVGTAAAATHTVRSQTTTFLEPFANLLRSLSVELQVLSTHLTALQLPLEIPFFLLS